MARAKQPGSLEAWLQASNQEPQCMDWFALPLFMYNRK